MDTVASRGVHFEHGIHFIIHTHACTHARRRCHCCSQIVILRTECPLMYLMVLVKI